MKRKDFLGLELLVLGILLVLFAQQLIDLKMYFSVPPTLQVASEKKFQSAETLLLGQKLNINLASQKDLETLPGIGPSLAQRILSYRQRKGPFKHTRDLLNVRGIGKKKFQEIEEYLTVVKI